MGIRDEAEESEEKMSVNRAPKKSESDSNNLHLELHLHSGGHADPEHHHVSHAAALTAEIIDPAAAKHIIEEEEKWVEDDVTESVVSSTQSPVTPEKNDLTIDVEEKGQELQRVQSKASLAAMMANFPDGGRRAWFTLAAACAIAFCTFGIVTSFSWRSNFRDDELFWDL